MNVYDKIGLHVCRACLTLSKEVQFIFQENRSVVSMLHALSIELNPTDKFPKHICMPCLEKLKVAHSFIEKFKDSQRLIQETVCSDEDSGIKKQIHENFQSKFEQVSDTIFIDDDSKVEVEPVENEAGSSVSCDENMLETKCTSRNPIKVRMDLVRQESMETLLETTKVEKITDAQNFENHVFSSADGKTNINLYDCQFCNASFNNFKTFCNHLMNHRDKTNGAISCNYCDGPSETFKNIKSYTVHLCINHKLIFRCQYCPSATFENFLSFCKHMKHNHKKLTLRDVFITPPVVSKELIVYPWENIQTTNFTCPYCTKTCPCLSQFRYHLWIHFSHQIGKGTFTCSTCKEVFALKGSLKNHHRKSSKCLPIPQKKKAKLQCSSSSST